jgi:hypothetical protein
VHLLVHNKLLEFLKFLCGGDCPLVVLRALAQYRHVGYRILEEFAASVFRVKGGGANVNLVDMKIKPTNAYTHLRVSYIINIVNLILLNVYMHLLVLYSYRIILMPGHGLFKKNELGVFFKHHSGAGQYVVLKCLYQSARFHSTDDNY